MLASEPVKIPWFDAVFADIGDEQSLTQSLSTFSGHLKQISVGSITFKCLFYYANKVWFHDNVMVHSVAPIILANIGKILFDPEKC